MSRAAARIARRPEPAPEDRMPSRVRATPARPLAAHGSGSHHAAVITRTWPTVAALLFVGLLSAALWRAHATAWDLGGRSPILSFDAAQYAVAARTLAESGRPATTFALPIELARHATPPWPLAVVQPGLVLVEAALLRLAPAVHGAPDMRDPLLLAPSALAFVAIAALLLLATRRMLAGAGAGRALVAGGVIAALFLLDPEAQHFATGGFTELPFTLLLGAACAMLASGAASRRPFLFGLLLGVAGAFRGSMLGLLPGFALAAAAIPVASTARVRATLALRVLAGFALPLAPWWILKWRAFGSPAWDLSMQLAPWDGVGGRTWFALTHRPVEPLLPHGRAAIVALLPKIAAMLPRLTATLAGGPRIVGLAALVVWLARDRGRRAWRATGIALLAAAAITLLTASLGAGWIRYLFPVRVLLDAAGVLALWALLSTTGAIPVRARALLVAGIAVLALAWGVRETAAGLIEARATSHLRGTPEAATLDDLARRVTAEVPEGGVVMSNLGPSLGWRARRTVLHLALDPAAVAECRARVEFRDVLLVFRDVEHAWPGWQPLIANPASGPALVPGSRERRWTTADGFTIVWLDLPARAAVRR